MAETLANFFNSVLICHTEGRDLGEKFDSLGIPVIFQQLVLG
jgi:hypothetical protein